MRARPTMALPNTEYETLSTRRAMPPLKPLTFTEVSWLRAQLWSEQWLIEGQTCKPLKSMAT